MWRAVILSFALTTIVDATVYGLIADADDNFTIAPLDLAHDHVKPSASGVSVHGVHFLDRMPSGTGMAIDGKASMAFIVGYTSGLAKQTNMSLFGISLRDGRVAINVTLPFPYWDNLDDHHTTVQLLSSGDLVVLGIEGTEGLRGGVAIVTQAGEVKRYHSLSSLPFGTYPKGTVALDADGRVMYMALASLGGNAGVLSLNLDSGKVENIELSFVVMSLAFDPTRHGFWALASNATQILTDGYYLLFFDAKSSSFAPPKALPRSICSSIQNPDDNWNLASTFDQGYFITRETCQPSNAQINERVAVIDVAAGSVLHRPLFDDLWGLASSSSLEGIV